jgi:hypothetical protein
MSKIFLSLLGVFAFLVGVWLFTPASTSATLPATPADEAPAPPNDAPLAIDFDLPEVAPQPHIAPNLSNPLEANPRLTRANFDKIHNWMTEEQVKSILGHPTSANIRTDPARGRIHRGPFHREKHDACGACDENGIVAPTAEGPSIGDLDEPVSRKIRPRRKRHDGRRNHRHSRPPVCSTQLDADRRPHHNALLAAIRTVHYRDD